MGLFFAPVANVVLSAVRPEEEGQASGTNNALREVGGVFGIAVLAAIFAHYGRVPATSRRRQAFMDGLTPALWTGAVILGIGAALALLIPNGGRQREAAADAVPSFVGLGGCVPTEIQHTEGEPAAAATARRGDLERSPRSGGGVRRRRRPREPYGERDDAELAHQPDVVAVDPALGELAVLDPVPDRRRDLDLVARRRDAEEVALVRPGRRPAARDLVVVGDDLVDVTQTSGNAERNITFSILKPSRPGSRPGSAWWSTKSGVTSSS